MFHCPAEVGLSSDCLQDLRASAAAFSKGVPRCINVTVNETVNLFTDAHYEAGLGGLGGVLFNARGEAMAWF